MSDNQQLTNILKTILQAGDGSGNPITTKLLQELVAKLKEFKETLGIKGTNAKAVETFVDSCEQIATEERLKKVPMEYSHIIETILERAPEDKYDGAAWRNTFAIDGNSGKMHQCVPLEVYQEMMKIEKEPEEQKRHYSEAESFNHMLLETHNLLMNEDRIIRSLEVPTGSEADSYTDKDGKRVMVEPATINRDKDPSGKNIKYPAEISIDQCGAQKTPEQCYLRRDEKGEQACLYMPHLAHLDPPLEGDAKKAWETLKTSACVDKRVVPFKMRNATGVDEKALRNQDKLNKEQETYQIGTELKDSDIIQSDKSYDTLEADVHEFCKKVNCQFDTYKAETAFNANQGNLVPVFFDKQGNSTYMSGLYDEYSLKHGVYGERVAEMQATMRKFAQKVVDGRGRSKYPDRIKAKLDKAYKIHKEQMDILRAELKGMRTDVQKKWLGNALFDKLQRDGKDGQKELAVDRLRYSDLENIEMIKDYSDVIELSKFVKYNDILAREVFEFAKELAQKKTIRENKAAIKKLLELSMDDKERPLLETKEKEECQAVLDNLVGDFYKINDGQGYIPVLSSRKPMSVKQEGKATEKATNDLQNYLEKETDDLEEKKPEDWKATGNEEHFEAPARRHAITLAEMPEPLANKMFIVLSGGGDPSLYNNFGEYVGLQKGKPLLRGGEGEKKCLFRLSRIAIMLLKGAARGGDFNTMAAMFKEIFKQKSKEVADDKRKGDRKRKERLFRVTQDEETLMEIMLYPQEALKGDRWKKARSENQYKEQLVRLLLETGGPYYYNTKKWMRSHAMDPSKLTEKERKLDGDLTDIIGKAVSKATGKIANPALTDDASKTTTSGTVDEDAFKKFVQFAVPNLIMDSESTNINFLKFGGFANTQKTVEANSMYAKALELLGQADTLDEKLRKAYEKEQQAIEDADKVSMWTKIKSWAGAADQTLDAGNWLWLMAKGAKAKVWKELSEEEIQTWNETIEKMKGNDVIQAALKKQAQDAAKLNKLSIEAYEALGGAAQAFGESRKKLTKQGRKYKTFTLENPGTKDEARTVSTDTVDGTELMQYMSKKSMHELTMLNLVHWNELELEIDTTRRVVDVVLTDSGKTYSKYVTNDLKQDYAGLYINGGGQEMAAFRNPGMDLEQFRKKMEESEFDATDNIGSALDFIESQRESLRAWSGKHQKLLEMWRQYVGAVPEKNLGARRIKNEK